MRRLGLVLACLIAIGVPLLVGAGSALAGSSSGCGGAGDSQYVDPLGCPTTSTSNSPPPTNPTQPPPTTSTTPPATVATTTTTVSSTTAHDPKGSLPLTGLDVWAAVALGLGLLGTGIAIRRSLPTGG